MTRYNLKDYHIEFEEEGHKYFVNGEQVVCLSNILSDVLNNNEPIPSYAIPAMARGTHTHHVIQTDLEGGVDPSSIDEECRGLFDSYSLFKKDVGLVPELIEKKIYCPSQNFCFTLDYTGLVDGTKRLIDWKTGGVYPKYKAQLGGQLRGLLDYFDDDCLNIGIVQLFKTGKRGKEIWYNKEEALFDWNSIKRVYDMRRGK